MKYHYGNNVINRVWETSRKQSCGVIAIAFGLEFRDMSYGNITTASGSDVYSINGRQISLETFSFNKIYKMIS
jgi:hypothetical protein